MEQPLSSAEWFAIGFHVLFWGILAILLVYLIVKRIKDKKNEDFEDRDN